MKRIETYDEYVALCSARLRGKVCTNEFPDAECCRREILAGGLYTEETDGTLLLFRKRESHLQMNFYLHSREKVQLPTDIPIVTEIAYRERDKAMAETVDYWEQQGFSLCFHRIRLCLSSELPPSPTDIPVRVADLADADAVASCMERNFDPLTGCLPLRYELESCLQNGEILLTEHGVLQFARGRVSAELRHLAVDESYRGCGEAQALLTEFRREVSTQRKMVWVREGNIPAEAIYRKNGFVPDGWVSTVLIRREDD